MNYHMELLVFAELYEASKQTANPWVFEPEYPGKSRLFDGRTGNPFEEPLRIGKPSILKLIHQVDDKRTFKRTLCNCYATTP